MFQIPEILGQKKSTKFFLISGVVRTEVNRKFGYFSWQGKKKATRQSLARLSSAACVFNATYTAKDVRKTLHN